MFLKLYTPRNLRVRGPFLESPESFQAHFGCHDNSICFFKRSRLGARSFAVIFGAFEKRAAVPEKAIRLSLCYKTFWKHPHWRAAPQIPLPDNLNWLSHQVHSHGFYNFKKILSQLFRFLKCFLSIGYYHFNLSFVFQANCDHVRKSKIEKRTKQKTSVSFQV